MNLLAIIIPYYKFTFFEESLQSLSNQTDKRFKVYIGDDASPENPAALLEKYKDKFEFTYHRFSENLGSISLTKQWERCIALSKDEEWLMILGDDDYLSDNYIEEFYNYIDEIKKMKINVIRFATKEINQEGIISATYTHPKIEDATDSFYRKIFKRSRASLSEHIFKREAYLKHGFHNFPLAWGSDDFAWLVFTDFGKIYTINKALAYFRISSENISRKGYQEEIKNETKYVYISLIIKKYLKKFEKKQRVQFLFYYEQMTYTLNKTSFRFWFRMCKTFFLENELIQIIKFNRRMLINHFKK